jgi:hypothetical protein
MATDSSDERRDSPRRQGINFSTLLAATFGVWRKNLVVVSVVFLPVDLVSVALFTMLAGPLYGVLQAVPGSEAALEYERQLSSIVWTALAIAGAGLVLYGVVVGGLTEYAVRRFRREAMDIRAILRRGLQRSLSILGAGIGLAFLLFPWLVLPSLLALAGASGAVVCGGILLSFFGFVVAIWLYVGMSLYAPAVMVENRRAVDGLARSWHLTKGHRRSLFGAILIVGILVSVANVLALFLGASVRHLAFSIASAAIVNVLVGPWPIILAAVAYDMIAKQPGYGTRRKIPKSSVRTPAGETGRSSDSRGPESGKRR